MADGYLERCGMTRNCGERFFLSFATAFSKNLVDAGMSIQNAARLPAHGTIQTTMRYVELPSMSYERQWRVPFVELPPSRC
ncbi:hypothetical protein ALPO108162_07260 [Alicyclobacillus pomorum]|jgi:hypothetical protein